MSFMPFERGDRELSNGKTIINNGSILRKLRSNRSKVINTLFLHYSGQCWLAHSFLNCDRRSPVTLYLGSNFDRPCVRACVRPCVRIACPHILSAFSVRIFCPHGWSWSTRSAHSFLNIDPFFWWFLCRLKEEIESFQTVQNSSKTDLY